MFKSYALGYSKWFTDGEVIIASSEIYPPDCFLRIFVKNDVFHKSLLKTVMACSGGPMFTSPSVHNFK